MIYTIYTVLYFLVFLIGACIGSFLNVLIYRLPLGLNVAKGFSFCPACNHRLYPKDLVPILSWLFLKAKCRYCGAKISAQYPIVELICGAVAAVSYAFLSTPYEAALVFVVFCALLTLSVIDFKTMEIPDSMHIVIIVCAVAAFFVYPEVGWLSRVIGLFCISVPMFIFAIVKEGAFGLGDVKLMGAAGLLLGWQATLLATFIGIITGGIYAVGLLITKSKGRSDHFAFGPFLAAGIFISLLWGDNLISWYLGLF
jgi:leader peptidase (prepilin peptidase)/N-methyltransferase